MKLKQFLIHSLVYIFLVWQMVCPLSLLAQEIFSAPLRGFVSEQPAQNWEHSLLSGNGAMGIMVSGEPYNETVTVNHALLYLPLNITNAVFPQGDHLPEIRSLLLNGEYQKANQYVDDLRRKSGFFIENESWKARDPFIAGFQIRIEQETGQTAQYQRSVNFATGETFTDWKNEKGLFRRSAFVSRPDSVIVIRLTGNAKINAAIAFEEVPLAYGKERIASVDNPLKLHEENFLEITAGLSEQWLSFRALYKFSNPYNTFRGYEGIGKIIHKGGSLLYAGNRVIARDVDELLLLVRIEPVPEKEETLIPYLKKFLDTKSTDYPQLVASHAKVHGDLFNRVKLDLQADTSDRALSSEKLIEKSQTDMPPPAMMEKAFDAGRYNIISSTGINPPNLQGLWSGTWSAPWYGSFTTNGNLETAIAFLLAGNTPSLMHSFFDWMERNMEGFRLSAKEMFHCRGFYMPSQITTNWRTLDMHTGCPLSYWVAVDAWVAQYYYDYYQYTGDLKFLKEKAFPLMKEAAAFYEDFLTVEQDGKFVFVPSYSPENSPGNTNSPAAVNATIEVMACRQLLRNCIQASKILKEKTEDSRTWKAMLNKMPEYQISPEGTLREWLWPGLDENYSHRHISHLYALFDEIPDEFKNNPTLKKAVETAIDYRLKFRESNADMAFGLCMAGWVAAHIENKRQTDYILNCLTRNYWSSGMGSFHDAGKIFNTDISGGYPYFISQCLVYSEPEYLKLLPACPDRWEKGSIEGLLLRGNVTLQKLAWDKESVEVTLLAPYSGNIKVEVNGEIKTVKLIKNTPVKIRRKRI